MRHAQRPVPRNVRPPLARNHPSGREHRRFCPWHQSRASKLAVQHAESQGWHRRPHGRRDGRAPGGRYARPRRPHRAHDSRRPSEHEPRFEWRAALQAFVTHRAGSRAPRCRHPAPRLRCAGACRGGLPRALPKRPRCGHQASRARGPCLCRWRRSAGSSSLADRPGTRRHAHALGFPGVGLP